MSSHHIVKAKQEPALLILSLQKFDLEYLGQLLEWSPTILVTANVYEEVESLGIKIDVVLGSIEAVQSDAVQLDVQNDYASTGLNYLIKEGYPAVNIIADEQLSIDLSYYDDINIVWFCGTSKIYRVKTGFSVWKAAGTLFKLNGDVQTTNLIPTSTGLYEVSKDGFVTFNGPLESLFIEEFL